MLPDLGTAYLLRQAPQEPAVAAAGAASFAVLVIVNAPSHNGCKHRQNDKGSDECGQIHVQTAPFKSCSHRAPAFMAASTALIANTLF